MQCRKGLIMSNIEELEIDKLAEPFRNEEIDWRVGPKFGKKTFALAYLDARAVMDRLDNVCTPSGWQCRHPYANTKTNCEVGIWFGNDGWIWKSDGAGDTAMEGEKGAFSGAFKRACVMWGIGRYLYDMGNTVVELDEKGKKIADGEYKKLNKAHESLIKTLPCLRGTHTQVPAIDEWVADRISKLSSYPDREDATLDNLDKIYKQMTEKCLKSRVTGGQLLLIQQQYFIIKSRLTEKKVA